MSPQLAVVLIALGWSAGVGCAGLLLARRAGRLGVRSVRAALVWVAAVSVLAVIAGVVGTARAMFLSAHDLGVAVTVSLVAGLVGLAVALLLSARVMADVRAVLRTAAAVGAGAVAPVPRAPAPRLRELRAIRDGLLAASGRLAESRRREEALDRSRRELVAWVSHDLRTPLAGLRAMAEALEDGLAEDPARYHRQMLREVDRLARMVDDLFELSRIQAGALALALDRVPVVELVGDVLAGTGPVAAARGVRLDAGPRAVAAAVDGDAGALGRVLANLVVNAIRHTPADGTVSVRTVADAGEVVLTVSDRCGGIAEDDLARVFDPGWRGTAARVRPTDAESDAGVGAGAGLGLAIARGIVEAHRGRIGVVNTDVGCRFEIRLPSATPRPRPT